MNNKKVETLGSYIFITLLFLLSIIPFICIGVSLYTLFLYNKTILYIMTYIFYIIFMFLMLFFITLFNYIDKLRQNNEEIKFGSEFIKSLKDISNIVLMAILFVVVTGVLIIFTYTYY